MNYKSLLLSMFNATYEWLSAQNCIPEIIIDAQYAGVCIPQHLMQTPHLVLNISMSSTEHWHANEDGLSFSARFGGRPFDCYIPLPAVKAFISRSMTPRVAIPMLDINAMLRAHGIDPAQSTPVSETPTTAPVEVALPSGTEESKAVEPEKGGENVVSLFTKRK